MTVVADASVAAKWFIREHDRDAAMALLSSEAVIAPDWVAAEILNIVWKNVRVGRLERGQIVVVAQTIPLYFSALPSALELAEHASEIALSLDHPLYDCFYIALAERERCDLVTADERLYRKTRRTRFASFVKPLSAKR
jgi:predicted nucleic acid-binding protein